MCCFFLFLFPFFVVTPNAPSSKFPLRLYRFSQSWQFLILFLFWALFFHLVSSFTLLLFFSELSDLLSFFSTPRANNQILLFWSFPWPLFFQLRSFYAGGFFFFFQPRPPPFPHRPYVGGRFPGFFFFRPFSLLKSTLINLRLQVVFFLSLPPELFFF